MTLTKVSAALNLDNAKGSDISSATTISIADDAGHFDVTGTTTITGMTVAANRYFTLQFDGALTLTHHASNLILNRADTNITTVAGDVGTFYSRAANQVVSWSKSTGQLYVPVSASDPAKPGIHFGAEPSGDTGIGIHTGTENKLRAYVQDIEAARLNSGGGIASWAFGSVGSEKIIADDASYEIALGNPGAGPDRSGIILFHTPTAAGANAVAMIYYRTASDVMEILSQGSSAKVTVAGGAVRTGTSGTDGKFNISCDNSTDKLYFENRLGASAAINLMFVGQGAGMSSA